MSVGQEEQFSKVGFPIKIALLGMLVPFTKNSVAIKYIFHSQNSHARFKIYTNASGTDAAERHYIHNSIYRSMLYRCGGQQTQGLSSRAAEMSHQYISPSDSSRETETLC